MKSRSDRRALPSAMLVGIDVAEAVRNFGVGSGRLFEQIGDHRSCVIDSGSGSRAPLCSRPRRHGTIVTSMRCEQPRAQSHPFA